MNYNLSYDDVLVPPRYSEVESRDDVDISSYLFRDPEVKLNIPILSAPMDTVTEWTMAVAMRRAGGIGVRHRFCSWEERIKDVDRRLLRSGFALHAIGVNETQRVIDNFKTKYIVIDIAHGHSKKMIEAIEALSKHFTVMAGNIATREAAADLIYAGASALKVGVGPGSHCTTRKKTGVGVPQITAIHEVSSLAHKHNVTVCADGGIQTSGDIVKALAAGADTVMLGSLLAGTDTAPGKIIRDEESGRLYKEYRGQASEKAKLDFGKDSRYVEGRSSKIPYKGSVYSIIQQLEDGIKSGFSYVGAHNIEEFREKAKLIPISPNTRNV